MLFSDVTRFMIIFAIFLLGLAMYLTVPPFVMDNTDDNSEGRWTLIAMLQDLVKLGLLCVDSRWTFVCSWETLTRRAASINSTGRTSAGGAVGTWGGSSSYIFYLLMSIILLLNLLIAMMGQTYEKTMEVSEIEWRVAFARRILLYETLAAAYNACRPKSKAIHTARGKYWPDGKHYHISVTSQPILRVPAPVVSSLSSGNRRRYRAARAAGATAMTPSPEHGELKGAATPLLATPPQGKGGLAPLPAGVSAVPTRRQLLRGGSVSPQAKGRGEQASSKGQPACSYIHNDLMPTCATSSS